MYVLRYVQINGSEIATLDLHEKNYDCNHIALQEYKKSKYTIMYDISNSPGPI